MCGGVVKAIFFKTGLNYNTVQIKVLGYRVFWLLHKKSYFFENLDTTVSSS